MMDLKTINKTFSVFYWFYYLVYPCLSLLRNHSLILAPQSEVGRCVKMEKQINTRGERGLKNYLLRKLGFISRDSQLVTRNSGVKP